MSRQNNDLRHGKRFIPWRRFRVLAIPAPLAAVPSAELPLSAKVVYGALSFHAGENGECFPSIDRLAQETGLAEKGVRKALKTLEDNGLIERTRPTMADRPRKVTARYFFLWHPWLEEKTPVQSTAVQPETEVQSTAVPGENTGTPFQKHRYSVPKTPVQSTAKEINIRDKDKQTPHTHTARAHEAVEPEVIMPGVCVGGELSDLSPEEIEEGLKLMAANGRNPSAYEASLWRQYRAGTLVLDREELERLRRRKGLVLSVRGLQNLNVSDAFVAEDLPKATTFSQAQRQEKQGHALFLQSVKAKQAAAEALNTTPEWGDSNRDRMASMPVEELFRALWCDCAIPDGLDFKGRDGLSKAREMARAVHSGELDRLGEMAVMESREPGHGLPIPFRNSWRTVTIKRLPPAEKS